MIRAEQTLKKTIERNYHGDSVLERTKFLSGFSNHFWMKWSVIVHKMHQSTRVLKFWDKHLTEFLASLENLEPIKTAAVRRTAQAHKTFWHKALIVEAFY